MTNKAQIAPYESEARTATPTPVLINTSLHSGMHVVINVTEISLTPSVVVTIDGKDPLSGSFYNILTSVAITGAGTTVLKIHPSILSVANLAAGDMIPKETRITMTHGDANSITYTASVMMTT